MDVLNKLGYPKDSKLLMIHADDSGLCHSENLATMQALKKGIVNSYSIMPNSPWFAEMADFAKNNDRYDLGIHLTLTCEWKYFKWGPLLSKNQVPSLVNKDGTFFNSKTDFKNSASAGDIRKELEAQIEKVFQCGLRPSHLDCHMYVVGLSPEFLNVYKALGEKFRLPVLLNKQLLQSTGYNTSGYTFDNEFFVDNLVLGTYEEFKKDDSSLFKFYETALKDLQAGLTMVLIHTAFDNEEMQAVTIDHPNFGSKWRQMDFDFFTSSTCESIIKENHITMITWKEIKNCLYPDPSDY